MATQQLCQRRLVKLPLTRRRIFGTLCLVLQLFPAAIAVAQSSSSQTRIVPDANWVKIYFESIDKLTKRLNFKPLRSIVIPPGDLEVRIWSGFGIQGFGGSIIKRTGNKWSAVSMYDPRHTQMINGGYVEANPKKGPKKTDWAMVWERMERAGIADIRDDSEIPNCSQILDGISYVVEIAKADFYRTYMVANPQLQRSEDGDKFLHVQSILAEAYGGTSTDDPARLPTGEDSIVASFSSDISVSSNPLGLRLDGSEYKVGTIPPEDSIIRLASGEGLAQGISLFVPQCYERPKPQRYIRRYLSGDVEMELFIQPDGSVSAAKALSGPPLLADETLQTALKWKFAPLTGSNKIRSTVISIRYKKEWVPFPWLK